MFRFLLLAVIASMAAAFVVPAAMPRLAASQTFAEPAQAAIVPRAALEMSAVTERDADGNPVTHTEMFDPIWVVVTISAFCFIATKLP